MGFFYSILFFLTSIALSIAILVFFGLLQAVLQKIIDLIPLNYKNRNRFLFLCALSVEFYAMLTIASSIILLSVDFFKENKYSYTIFIILLCLFLFSTLSSRIKDIKTSEAYTFNKYVREINTISLSISSFILLLSILTFAIKPSFIIPHFSYIYDFTRQNQISNKQLLILSIGLLILLNLSVNSIFKYRIWLANKK